MGKQINYYMGYNEFLTVAQKALDLGCTIFRSDDGKIIGGNDIGFITEDESSYWFHLPEAGELSISVSKNGQEYIGGYNATGNAIIEAKYSRIDKERKLIFRSRLFVISGYYDDNGAWVERPDCLTKTYEKLVRTAKKVAPYTELTGIYTNSENEECECRYKEYVTPEFLQFRNELGYSLAGY